MRQATLRQPRRNASDELQSIPASGPASPRTCATSACAACGAQRPEPRSHVPALVHWRGVQQDRCVLYVFRCAYTCEAQAPQSREAQVWN